MLNLSNFTIHCDIKHQSVLESVYAAVSDDLGVSTLPSAHDMRLSAFTVLHVQCSAASGVLAWNQLQTSLRDWIEGQKDRDQ